MTSFCYYHTANEAHDPGPVHSERAARMTAIVRALRAIHSTDLIWKESPLAEPKDLTLAHTPAYIDFLLGAVPQSGYQAIEVNEIVSDDDGGEVTVLCPYSGEAILRSVGGALDAINAVTTGKAHNAFCLTRPPGHHALADKAMGFCAVNNIAIAARYAQHACGMRRVAIVDFDVHHGNGTQAIFEQDPSVFFASIHQSPLWPESGHSNEFGVGNILNVPVMPDTPREEWLGLWQSKIMARLEQEEFDLLLLSAGFDAHKNDPKGSQHLETEDYAHLTQDLLECAARQGQGRVVALLEGGYDIEASAQSAAALTQALLKAPHTLVGGR